MSANAGVSRPAARKVVIWERFSECVRAWEAEMAALARTNEAHYWSEGIENTCRRRTKDREDVTRNSGVSSGPYSQAKSSVTPKCVPSSSLRAYRFPIEVFESSTCEKMPAFRSFDAGPKQ